MKLRFAFFIAIHFLGTTLWASDPVADLKKWLEQEPRKRAELTEQTFARDPLTQDQADQASELLLKDFQKRIKKERQQQWKDREIKLGNHSMKFAFRVFGEKPKTGSQPLYLDARRRRSAGSRE